MNIAFTEASSFAFGDHPLSTREALRTTIGRRLPLRQLIHSVASLLAVSATLAAILSAPGPLYAAGKEVAGKDCPAAAPLVGLIFEGASPAEVRFARRSAAALEAASEGRIVTKRLTQPALERAAQEGRLAAAILPAALAARLERLFGARAAAAFRPPYAENPAEAAGVLLLSIDPAVQELEDLAGRRIAVLQKTSDSSVNGSTASGALLPKWLLLEEFRRRSPGSEPPSIKALSEEFAVLPEPRPTVAPGNAAQRLREAFMESNAAAIALPACFLEDAGLTIADLVKNSPPTFAALHAAGIAPSPGFRCLTSTRLFPSLILTVFPDFEKTASEHLVASLLAMPPSEDGEWRPAPSLLPTAELLQAPSVPDSLSLHPWNWGRFLNTYRIPLLALALALCFLLAHGIVLERLVKRRTASLVRAMNEKERLEKDRAEAQRRFDAMEKAGIVGELSSMVAHELKQPLTVIGSYSEGAKRMLARGTLTDARLEEALNRIFEASGDAAAVIDRVRNYAKSPKRRMDRIAIVPFARSVLEKFSTSSSAAGVNLSFIADSKKTSALFVLSDPLELHFAIRNLLKNACEAVKNAPAEQHTEARVTLTVFVSPEGGACLAVRDNGPKLSQEDAAHLGEPLRTTKPDGLGLGLTIVRRIAENQGAVFELLPLSKRGLEARLLFPPVQTQVSLRAAKEAHTAG